MHIPARRHLIPAVLLATCLATSVASAQQKEPGPTHCTQPPIAEATSPTRSAPELSSRLWTRLAAWSARRPSSVRWRALTPTPVIGPGSPRAGR